MQPLRKKVRFNYHDYQQLPGDKRYQIIDGDLLMTPAPLTIHQDIVRNLTVLLSAYLSQKKLGKLLISPVDVILSDEDIVQPDLVFISEKRLNIVTAQNIQGPPDLVIEILSPSSKKMDREIKLKLYEKHGVYEYWIVDPDAQSIEVFNLTDDGLKLLRAYPKGTHLSSPLFPDIKLSVEKVFSC